MAGWAVASGFKELMCYQGAVLQDSNLRFDGLCAGGDARGSGSEDELASFSDAEAYILEQEGRGGTASKQLLQQWRSDYRRHLGRIKRLEQV